MPGSRKLGRPTAHRKAMLRGMVTYLLEHGQIETTYTRAKEVSALADKMMSIAKQNNLAAYRQLLTFITKQEVAKKLMEVTAHLYRDIPGGYTQVYKTGPRRGDGAEMAVIRLTPVKQPEPEQTEKPKKRAAKKAKPQAEPLEA